MAISSSSKAASFSAGNWPSVAAISACWTAIACSAASRPGGGQIDRVLAAVGGGGAALDEAGALEPVEQAGNIALGDVEALGELLLADPLRLGQRRQHVALGNRKPDFAQPLGDRELQSALQADETEPDADREVFDSPCSSIASIVSRAASARSRGATLQARSAPAICDRRRELPSAAAGAMLGLVSMWTSRALGVRARRKTGGKRCWG